MKSLKKNKLQDFLLLLTWANSKNLYENVKVKVLVTQSSQTLCDPIDCSQLGPSLHGISQARILERVAISFSRESSCFGNWTQVSCIASRFFTIWATREAHVEDLE